MTFNLSIFAYHISELMTVVVGPEHTREKPYVLRFTAGLSEGDVTVELWYSGVTPIWDHTRVNGVDTGNRCGAREEICRIVNESHLLKGA